MTATAAEAFAAWDAFLGPIEGGLSMVPTDPGNWTGGKPGLGELKGTKYGIASNSHPKEDIANLTIERARFLRKTEYWDAVKGDILHPSVSFVAAEAAYGSGPHRAVLTLQQVVGVNQDGEIGKLTEDAVARAVATPDKLTAFLVEFSAQRIVFESTLNNWVENRLGWARRLFKGIEVAASLDDVALMVPLPAPPVVAPMPFMLSEGKFLVTVERTG